VLHYPCRLMTFPFINTLIENYCVYVNKFRDASGAWPVLLRLKYDHTNRVAMEARNIMKGEGWDKYASAMGEACAFLHDVARYVQYQAFGTFRDSDSFDHADCAVEIIRQQGWLDALTEEERQQILTAVALHNKREVPAALAGFGAELVHLVRDADKLDIFRVLEDAVKTGSLARNPEIAWGLQMEGAPNPEVIEAVSNGQTVSYDAVRVFADFVLIQVGWLNGGLHFKTAVQFAKARDTLAFREELLKTLTDDHEGIARCCAAARECLERCV